MKKTTKHWLIAAAVLAAAGLIVLAAVMIANRWELGELSTVEYETNTYVIDEEFDNISLKTRTADILFVPCDDGVCRVVCYEPENAKHTVSVDGATLKIKAADERAWNDYVGITPFDPKLTVYLPESEYAGLFIEESTGSIEIPNAFGFESIDIIASTGSVECLASVSGRAAIFLSTGDIRIDNAAVGSLDLTVTTGTVTVNAVNCEGDIELTVSTGKAYLTGVNCRGLTTTGSTGDITLENVIAAERFSIERSTGDVKFDGCDAAEIYVKTSTGDVSGTLISDKVFICSSNTGSIDVPKTTSGGKCEIDTHTGQIKIEIK